MSQVTFITGNPAKADFLAQHLGHSVEHCRLDLDEIQSLDLKIIAGHKAKQAYQAIKSPVLVEDVEMVIEAMGRLPGPFIKWFELEIGLDGICKLVDSFNNRNASIAVCFAYFDGKKLELFHGELKGQIAERPRGSNGFGFDPIFIRDDFNKTMAEMTNEELELHSLRTTTVYPQIKKFLAELDKIK